MCEHYCIYKDGLCELDVDEAYRQGIAETVDLIDLYLWNYSPKVCKDFRPILEQIKKGS